MQKIAVLTPQNSEELDLRLKELYPNSEIKYFDQCLKLRELITNAKFDEIIIDFDVADMEQVELVEWLKRRKKDGLIYHFLSDLNLHGEEKVVVPIDHEKVEKFIQKILPIRDKISNMYIKIPFLKVSGLDFMQYSYYDDQGLYFNSHKFVDEETLPLELTLSFDENSERTIHCTGKWTQVEKNDQDLGSHFYYKLILDQNSKEALKEYFEHYEKLNEFVSQWCQVEDSDGIK